MRGKGPIQNVVLISETIRYLTSCSILVIKWIGNFNQVSPQMDNSYREKLTYDIEIKMLKEEIQILRSAYLDTQRELKVA